MRIELKELSMVFPDGNEVIHGLNYADDVKTLSLIGPSGGGKSTLLRIIAGLLTPTRGAVSLGGEDMPAGEAARVQYRRNLGYVFQQNGLFRHLDAVTNIALPLEKVHGQTAAQAREIAMGLLARFGLADAARKRPGELSGGQQQRIAIARAIAPRPRLLLLDEPTSALDPEYTAEVLDTIDELRAEGLNFIIVTHEMGFARRACEKVAFLADGRIVEHGASAAVFARPASEELRRFLRKLLSWTA
ncbi:MAG: amino acid ABC transporter ATP-binding protein [Christensenellales bacterium]|jgi:polar amino acid transport system ATP-binding protein